jgi:hypothetical protein
MQRFNLTAKLCCRFAAGAATSSGGCNLWLWRAATTGAVSVGIVEPYYVRRFVFRSGSYGSEIAVRPIGIDGLMSGAILAVEGENGHTEA